MPQYSELIERAEGSTEFWRSVTALEFLKEVHLRMAELRINRAELARRMGHSKAYVTKLLSGNSNFTLITMIKVAMALRGIVHTHIADRDVVSLWHDMRLNHAPTFITHSDIQPPAEQHPSEAENEVLVFAANG
jgi:hypothetical protein